MIVAIVIVTIMIVVISLSSYTKKGLCSGFLLFLKVLLFSLIVACIIVAVILYIKGERGSAVLHDSLMFVSPCVL